MASELCPILMVGLTNSWCCLKSLTLSIAVRPCNVPETQTEVAVFGICGLGYSGSVLNAWGPPEVDEIPRAFGSSLEAQ